MYSFAMLRSSGRVRPVLATLAALCLTLALAPLASAAPRVVLGELFSGPG